jgi:transcriptional regulator with XRE-family HTH domain
MVWMTDAGHTMLVPVSSGMNISNDVFENTHDQYDIFTNTLLQNWNKLERTLAESRTLREAEEDEEEDYKEEDDQDDEDDEDDEEDEDNEETGFRTSVDNSTVDRKRLLKIMRDRNYNVSELADKIGVWPAAISRVLREPSKSDSGRDPSLDMAGKICDVLGTDASHIFPDKFKNESINRRIGTICEDVAKANIPFDEFWNKLVTPTLLKGNYQSTKGLVALLEWWWGKKKPKKGKKKEKLYSMDDDPSDLKIAEPIEEPIDAEAATDEEIQAEQQRARREAQIAKTGKALGDYVKKGFISSLDSFLQNMHNTIYNKNDPHAMHRWAIAQQLYTILKKSASTYEPKFVHAPKGTSYKDKYAAARTAAMAADKDIPTYSLGLEQSDRNKQIAKQKRQDKRAIDPRTAR